MVRKVQDWKILSRNRVYHLYKSVPFNGKRPRGRETGIKDGFEEKEHEFPFRIFHPEKKDYHFRCSIASGNFPLDRLHLLLNRISRKTTTVRLTNFQKPQLQSDWILFRFVHPRLLSSLLVFTRSFNVWKSYSYNFHNLMALRPHKLM